MFMISKQSKNNLKDDTEQQGSQITLAKKLYFKVVLKTTYN